MLSNLDTIWKVEIFMKNLVVVESPTKARTIGRFLGSDYLIKASMGHVMDLPKSKLGVDVEDNFSPQYELIPDRKKTIAELKSSLKNVESIILATDPDREGEAIAHHLREILQISNNTNKPIQRIVFHEITKEAIDEALKKPRDIDQNLVDAQTARRVLDRLVGYKISPILWQKIRRGLSAGRVQSVALRLIVEREREIEKFKKEKYYTISVLMVNSKLKTQNSKPDETEFELIEINDEKIEIQKSLFLYDGEYRVTKTSIESLENAKKIVEDLKNKEFIVADVLKKEVKRSPYPPFTTSTLQQEGARRLGFSGKRTMTVAQKLYEEGFITYHRTDSVTIAKSAIFAIRKFVEKELGNKYLPDKPRFYKTRQKLAQEAHEAIRPTHVGELQAQSLKLKTQMANDAVKLYELIWKRAVASQMADAVLESTTVVVDSKSQKSRLKNQDSKMGGETYRFKAGGSVLIFDGFLKVNPQGISDTILPDFKVSQELVAKDVLDREHETPPPPRYNDASLVATLEEKGIGRPSTYATIISTIEGRQYIERLEGRFIPTPVGVAVNDFLVKNFSTIDDIPFTAEMEDQLDAVANEKKEWVPMIKNFYKDFEKNLEDVKSAARIKIDVEEINEKCPKCAATLVIRIGRFGKFISCSTFPKCNFTKPYAEETGYNCPKDSGKIILKKSKKGRYFYGCSNYPKCDFAAWKLEEVKKQSLSS